MTLKVDGVNIVAGIAHTKTVAPAFLQVKWRQKQLSGPSGKRPPLIVHQVETLFGGIVLCEGHLERFIRRKCDFTGFCETQIIPMKQFRRCPRRLCFVSRIFQDNTHAVTAIVIRKITP